MSIEYFFRIFAQIIGAIVSAFAECHPKYIFITYSITGLIVGITSIFMDREAEKEIYWSEEDPGESDFSSE